MFGKYLQLKEAEKKLRDSKHKLACLRGKTDAGLLDVGPNTPTESKFGKIFISRVAILVFI